MNEKEAIRQAALILQYALDWADDSKELAGKAYRSGALEGAAFAASCILAQNHPSFKGGIGASDVMEITRLFESPDLHQIESRILETAKAEGREAKTVSHMFDCAASIESTKSFDELTVPELCEAMRVRLASIEIARDREAFGDCESSHELQPTPTPS